MALAKPEDEKRKRPAYPAAADSRPDMYSAPPPSGQVDPMRVLGVSQDVAAMKSAYNEGGVDYMVGDALNRGARSFGNSMGTLWNKGVVPFVGDVAGSVMDFGRGLAGMDLKKPGQPQTPTPTAPAATPAPTPDGVAEETAQPQPNAQAAPKVGENVPDDVLTVGSPYGMSGTLYANTTPPAGSGKVIYSDTKEGAQQPPTEGGGGFMRLLNPGRGPFGRTLQNQAQIDQNVAAYERAAGIYRGMNEDARRRNLESRASGSVSLNQSLGNFLNQASNRNYARERLKQVEAGDIARDRTAVESADKQNKMALEIAKLNKPDFQPVEIPTGEVDLYGKPVTREILVDPNSGKQVDPLATGGVDPGDSRVAPPEAVAQLKEMLRKAGTPEEKKRIKEQFQEMFDLPKDA